jgi:hypothetical protein
MQRYEHGDIWRQHVLVEVHTMHVDQVNAMLGERAVDGGLKAPVVPAAIGLADQGTLGHRSREELAGDQ